MGKALKRKGDKNMKKMRKIFAVLLTLAMVLGMSMTSFAAGQITDSYKNSITVTNLAQGVKTNVSLVNIIYLNDNNGNQEWTVVDWAKNYIEVDKTTGNYKIKSERCSKNPNTICRIYRRYCY